MWFVEPRELRGPDGAGSGIFHLVAESDEGGGTVGCCAHPHRTPAEAQACPDAIERSHQITGVRPPAAPVLCYGSDGKGGVRLCLGDESIDLDAAKVAALAEGLVREAARKPGES